MTGSLDFEMLAHLQAVLAHWAIPPVTSIAALDEAASVFKVTTAGLAFTLKDISNAPDLNRLAFTRSVLTHVARAGIRVPLAILTREAKPVVAANGQFYLLTEFIEAGEYPSDPALQAELFYNTGQAIAGLHQSLALYLDEEVSSKTWRDDLAGRVGGWIAALGDGLPATDAAVVRRAGLARGAAIADALCGLPEQLIHRDCHPGNILVRGTQVIGFIDCDHLCIGPRLFDVAYYAVHHLKWITDNEAATQRWLADLPHLLAGYRSQQHLSEAELAALPSAMMTYHLLLAHWFMGLPQHDSIALEVRALDWIDRHFDAILTAATSSELPR